MTIRKAGNGIDPGHIGALKALPQQALLLHCEAILERKGGDPLTDIERNDRCPRRRRTRRRAVPT